MDNVNSFINACRIAFESVLGAKTVSISNEVNYWIISPEIDVITNELSGESIYFCVSYLVTREDGKINESLKVICVNDDNESLKETIVPMDSLAIALDSMLKITYQWEFENKNGAYQLARKFIQSIFDARNTICCR